ncbi:MAG: zinc ABC transporter substrate-binding protein [Alphaproteobacteria bacterium]|nr:zinc ABC transporter substrate-binding protein [Alphaproteobacteria bacterium]
MILPILPNLPNFQRFYAQLASILVVMVILSLIIFPRHSHAEPAPLRVIASFSILGDLIKQIGGDRVNVTVLVAAGGDPHLYQAKPSDAVAMAKADLVVVNGLGFDRQMTQMAKASRAGLPLLIASERVTPLRFNDEFGGDMGQNATGEKSKNKGAEIDPHAWQSPKNTLLYVESIADSLSRLDPAHASYYQQNLAEYRRQLRQLDAELHQKFDAVPPRDKIIITSHDAFGYFGHEYGIRFAAPLGFATENEASASAVAALIGQIRRAKIKVIFVESISDPRIMQQIARETGAKIGGALYSDSLSPPHQPAHSYLDMMRYNSQLFAEAFTRTQAR